jgi:hypothetical protein
MQASLRSTGQLLRQTSAAAQRRNLAVPRLRQATVGRPRLVAANAGKVGPAALLWAL